MIVITGTETVSDLEEAIGNLRTAQYAATDTDAMLARGVDMDRLLDVLANGHVVRS